MKKLIVYLKGILLGFVGLAIPGLSASTIALEVNIYYEMIDAISNLFKRFKTSIIFLIFLVLGYFSGGFIGSVIIHTVYNDFPLIIILLIIGFILGGIPNMYHNLKPGLKKVSCYITMLVIIAGLLAFTFLVKNGEQITFENMEISDYIILFFVGIFTSSTLVIPGVDFAVLLISIGYYQALISLIAEIFVFQDLLHKLLVLGVYLVGYGIGSFLLSKVIKLLLDKFQIQSQFASFAFVIIAPFIVIKKGIIDNPNYSCNTIQCIIGAVLGIGAFLGMFFAMRYFRLKHEKEKVCEENVEV